MSGPRSAGGWHVAQLKPQGLTRARTHLERQGYDCFMPMRPGQARRGRRAVEARVPLFPGYLFVRIGPDQAWRPIQSTMGVSRLVMRAANAPQPVPESLIAALMARMETGDALAPPDALVAGLPVRVVAGPMTDLLGRVEHLPAAGRVGLLLEILGQTVRAELPHGHILPLAG